MHRGVVAEFDSPEALVAAIGELHAMGYAKLEAFTPYPLLEVEQAMKLPRSVISRYALMGACLGALIGFGLQWWTNVENYPLNVGAFAPGSLPPFVPITFETVILGAALTIFFGVLVLMRLPRWWDPIFEVDGFERASIDRFFLAVDARDKRFTPLGTAADLRQMRPLRVSPLGEQT